VWRAGSVFSGPLCCRIGVSRPAQVRIDVMLEKVDLTRAIPKEEYKARMPALQASLYDLQLSTSEAGLPSVIVFEGWEAAGKGTCINVLTSRLEPRAFKLHVIQEPRTHELHMPWLYRFWQRIPSYGQMAIFDRSWYRRVLEERVEKITPKSEWQKAYRDISDFERTLADDGYAVVKLFFHIAGRCSRRIGSATRNTTSIWWPPRRCWSAPNPNGGRGRLWRPPTDIGRASRFSRRSYGH
jgi:polyphosphate kinase 2 (PPK2 family)